MSVGTKANIIIQRIVYFRLQFNDKQSALLMTGRVIAGEGSADRPHADQKVRSHSKQRLDSFRNDSVEPFAHCQRRLDSVKPAMRSK